MSYDYEHGFKTYVIGFVPQWKEEVDQEINMPM
jgi:hypothetical protein